MVADLELLEQDTLTDSRSCQHIAAERVNTGSKPFRIYFVFCDCAEGGTGSVCIYKIRGYRTLCKELSDIVDEFAV